MEVIQNLVRIVIAQGTKTLVGTPVQLAVHFFDFEAIDIGRAKAKGRYSC